MWLARAALAALVAGLPLQIATVLGVASFHVERRGDRQIAQVYRDVATRWFDGDVRFAATAAPGRVYSAYALYPHRPVHVRFRGVPAARLRQVLSSRDVRYVLVTPPVVPPALAGSRRWLREVERVDSPFVRVLEVVR